MTRTITIIEIDDPNDRSYRLIDLPEETELSTHKDPDEAQRQGFRLALSNFANLIITREVIFASAEQALNDTRDNTTNHLP